jgi:hypothetical protein
MGARHCVCVAVLSVFACLPTPLVADHPLPELHSFGSLVGMDIRSGNIVSVANITDALMGYGTQLAFDPLTGVAFALSQGYAHHPWHTPC